MTLPNTAITIAVSALLAVPALAQTTSSEVQRDVNQQQRIENGLQSGQLSTKEAAKLEKGEANIEKMESKAEANGNLGNAEKQRIQRAQNKESQEIYRDTHNAQTGNPNSASSQRMQADVQRNINQQNRIEQGVQSGSLTTREAGRLERGEAHDSRLQARAGADGQVSAKEQRRVQKSEKRESQRIRREKHDAQHK